MGKESGAWIHQQCPPHQAPNLNCTSIVPDSTAWPNALPDCANPSHIVSNEPTLGCTGYKVPQFKTGVANGPQGWFYGLPRYRQALLNPTPDCAPKEINDQPGGCNKGTSRNAAVSQTIEKKFLVFDHSGNQTRLVYSPGTVYPNHCLNNGNPKGMENSGFQIGKWSTQTSPHYEAGPINSYGDGENLEIGAGSEMHEDTEELNALLYSDEDEDEDEDSDCGEEASTGHSPCKLTGRVTAEENGSTEEVASTGGCHLKRKRPLEEEFGTSSVMDTASSGKPHESSECEDDAESSCNESSNDGEELCLLPLNKRMKREKIRETVNILQNIIPGGKGKDAVYVLDEAIQYLKSLKLKAKTWGESVEQQ